MDEWVGGLVPEQRPAIVHGLRGWRGYQLDHCHKLNRPVLVGAWGMHVHDKLSPPAACRANGEHEGCPDINCACGFYLMRELDLSELAGRVLACATGWGTAIIHERGYRVQYLHLHALYWPLDPRGQPWPRDAYPGTIGRYWWQGKGQGRLRDYLEEIAEWLGLPLITEPPYSCEHDLYAGGQGDARPA